MIVDVEQPILSYVVHHRSVECSNTLLKVLASSLICLKEVITGFTFPDVWKYATLCVECLQL